MESIAYKAERYCGGYVKGQKEYPNFSLLSDTVL